MLVCFLILLVVRRMNEQTDGTRKAAALSRGRELERSSSGQKPSSRGPLPLTLIVLGPAKSYLSNRAVRTASVT